MCGITGFIQKEISNDSLLKAMNDSIAYRGPDSQGIFQDTYNSNFQIGLAHRRLAIQDLSPLGHQPMFSQDNNIIVVFNGEIYNFKELKITLEKQGFTFTSNSDTEVIINAFLAYGIEFIKHLNGMFAIALYDKRTQNFYLIRDRLGVKPLYYALYGENLIFGSELKPIIIHPLFQKEINFHALSLFIYHGYITAPHTIFTNIFKLQPGTYLHFNNGKVTHHTYWSVENKYQYRLVKEQTENEWVESLDTLLTHSIQDRMMGDVPIGAFLSGGIDSSLVTAIMQKVNNDPIKTFTIGFHEDDFNEAPFAKEVSKHLGTDHQELYLPLEKAKDLIPQIATFYDEPFADASQLPTMLLSKMTREQVTVALSGDGGDELFCGYGRYTDVINLKRFQNVSNIANKIPFFEDITHLLTKNSKFTQFFKLDSDHHIINSAYLNYIDHMNVLKDHTIKFDNTYNDIMEFSDNIQEKHMLQDMITYLPDDILTKVDRASMAYSLEARAPFIDDHRVIEFSFEMPHELKFKNGEKKYILKKLLGKYIPDHLINRPKMGFGVPIYDWLRGDLQYLIDQYMNHEHIEKQNIFNSKAIQNLKLRFQHKSDNMLSRCVPKNYKLHKDGAVDRMIWHIIVFQLWYDRYFLNNTSP